MSNKVLTITRSTPNSQESRAKRHRSGAIAIPPLSREGTAPTIPTKTLSHTEAVLASAVPYNDSIHPELQITNVPTLKNNLKSLATYLWKDKKHTEILND